MIEVYGLTSCETCRRARKWLAEQGIAHRFHDLRADGLDAARLRRWVDACGWEALLNRRSTTWRGLSEAERAGLDAGKAAALMSAHPTLIKRPVFEAQGAVLVGFSPAERARLAAGG